MRSTPPPQAPEINEVGFVRELKALIAWNPKFDGQVTIAVTERYARRILKRKADEPLEYRGLQLRCIGSKRWREAQRQ